MLVAAEDAPNFKTPRMKEAVRVGCQGTVGANSETAAQAFFPERHIQFYPTFEQVFEAVESGELEYGVLPIYNSTSGTVTQTVDLMGKYSFFITAMNQVEVMHCLAALPDAKMENITEVYSHPQALSQCSDFLDARSLHSHDYSNTATAAKMVAESGDKTIAAICSEDCAKHNRLQILASRISNVVPNFTQFICITKDMQVAENASVISVMLSISNEPGSLSRILNKFFLYGLDMTKIESGNMQMLDTSFDLRALLDSCCSIVEGQIVDRHMTFTKQIGPFWHPYLIGSELHIRQVLINILSNAVKYTPDGGEINFRAKETLFEEGLVHLRMEIKDNGIGMSEEFLQHIFEPFTQEQRSSRTHYKGTGLGMAITKKLVDQMHGSLDVESEPGKGSTFIVRLSLPLGTPTKAEPSVVVRHAASAAASGSSWGDASAAGAETAAAAPAAAETVLPLAGLHLLLAKEEEAVL